MKKFIISTDALKPALKKLSQAVSKNSVLPILSNLYCKIYNNEVQLITSHQELTIIYTVPCESKEIFEVLIPFEFIKKVTDLSGSQPMIIEANGRKGKISCTNDSYEMNSLDKVKDFINLPEVPKEHFISINGTFIQWLNKAQATCSKDEKDTRINKICLDISKSSLTMASTDKNVVFTHRFAVEAKKEDQLLISPKIAKALEGFDSTEIFWNKQHISFKSGNIEIIATRHEEKFVNYSAVFPDSESNLLLDRAAVSDALVRACLNSDGTKHTTIFLKREPGTIHFETDDINLNRKIQIDIPGSYKGELETISVNAAKLLVMMDQVDYDKVQFHIHDAKKAIVITSESDPDYKSLIMPLTVNE